MRAAPQPREDRRRPRKGGGAADAQGSFSLGAFERGALALADLPWAGARLGAVGLGIRIFRTRGDRRLCSGIRTGDVLFDGR